MNEQPLTLFEDKHSTRFIYPFTLRLLDIGKAKACSMAGVETQRQLFNKLIDGINIDNNWESPRVIKFEYILPHVLEFLVPDKERNMEERYVFTYQLSNNYRQKIVSGQGKCQLIVKKRIPNGAPDNKKEKNISISVFPFEMKNVRLTIFRSGVGMMSFDISMKQNIFQIDITGSCNELETDKIISCAIAGESIEVNDDYQVAVTKLPYDLDSLALFNRLFRSLVRNNRSGYIRRPRNALNINATDNGELTVIDDNGQVGHNRLKLHDLIDFLLLVLGKRGETWEASFEEQPLVYCYALVTRAGTGGDQNAQPLDFETELSSPLYRLRRSLDSNYHPTSLDLEIEGNPEVIQTFENIYFGMSSEGTAVVVLDTGVAFIRDSFHERVMGAYYLVFLIALHQRLATIYLAQQISRTSFVRHSRDLSQQELATEIQQIRKLVFEFMVQCYFAEVSDMSMYTKTYRGWQRIFEVEPLVQEVKSEVEELDDFLQRIQNEIQREQMDRQTKLINTLSVAIYAC